jgi:hypothetical protein
MRIVVIAALAVLALAPAAQSQTKVGDFSFVDRSDVEQVVVYTNAINRSGYLAWACVRGSLRLYVSPGRSLGEAYTEPVQWRLDDEDAAGSHEWDVADGGRGAYAPEDAIAPLTASARVSETVVVQMSGKQTYKFRLKGLGKALEMLPCTLEPPEPTVSLADE